MDSKELERVKRGMRFLPKAPKSRVFSVGEYVYYPHADLISAQIKDILFEGFYSLELTLHESIRGTKTGKAVTAVFNEPWTEIFKLTTDKACDIRIGQALDLDFIPLNIENVIGKCLRVGVNFDPEYQRGYVWSMEDKIALLDSIFNNIEIGKVVLIKKHEYGSNDPAFEVLDGKQRLSTLIDFFLDGFEYKGFLYSELPRKLQRHFREFKLPIAETRYADATPQKVLEYFLRLNTGGKSMDKEHLDRVRNMLDKI